MKCRYIVLYDYSLHIQTWKIIITPSFFHQRAHQAHLVRAVKLHSVQTLTQDEVVFFQSIIKIIVSSL